MTAAKYNTTTTQSRNDQRRSREAGLRQRFERDVVPLREILYRHAFRLSQNHADAEDLQQEAMLRAYAAFHSFQADTNLNAWLLRILTNSYIDGYRKKRRQPAQYSTEQVTDQDLAEACAQGRRTRSAEDEVLDALPDTEIRAAMQALPRQFREVVYYADVEGLRYKEIAAIMKTPSGTVTSRLLRGRRRLRGLLGNGAGGLAPEKMPA